MVYGTNLNTSDAVEFVKNESYWKNNYNLYPTGEKFEELAHQSRAKIQEDLMAQLAEIDKSKSEGITNSKDWFAQSLGASSKATQQGVLDDFVSANMQKSAILGSNLGQGYKESMLDSLDAQLDRAYESWYSNYRNNNAADRAELESTISGYESAAEQARAKAQANAAALQADITAVEEQNQKMVAALDEALLAEGQNYVDFYDSIFDYIDYLYSEDSGIDSTVLEQGPWREYFMDADGYIGSSALSSKMFSPLSNESNDLVLNDLGRDIISFIMSNPLATTYDTNNALLRDYTYDQYLATNNEDLANWLMDTSLYATNDNYMTNKDYALKAYGLDSNYKTSNSKTVAQKYNLENPDKADVVVDGMQTNYYRGYDFGDIAVYPKTGQSEQIIAFNDLTVDGEPTDDGDNFKATYTDDAGNERVYKLELTSVEDDENAIVDSTSNIYKYIKYNVGNIQTNKLYAYGNDVYIAVDSGAGVVLRKLQSPAGSDSYDILTKTMKNEAQWGNRYNIGDINRGYKILDGSLAIKAKEDAETQAILDRNKEYLKDPKGNQKPGYHWDTAVGGYVKSNQDYNPRKNVGK